MINISLEKNKKGQLKSTFKLSKKEYPPEMWATLLYMIGKEGPKLAQLLAEHLTSVLPKKEADKIGGMLVMMNQFTKQKDKLTLLEIAKTPITGHANVLLKENPTNEG